MRCMWHNMMCTVFNITFYYSLFLLVSMYLWHFSFHFFWFQFISIFSYSLYVLCALCQFVFWLKQYIFLCFILFYFIFLFWYCFEIVIALKFLIVVFYSLMGFGSDTTVVFGFFVWFWYDLIWLYFDNFTLSFSRRFFDLKKKKHWIFQI